jgi:hypothetical protein
MVKPQEIRLVLINFFVKIYDDDYDVFYLCARGSKFCHEI